ncbi:MAG TPA: hypothetical protein VMV10_24405 [Pirellulales bacterium]|nr:hypothetical protein [Pirellulales bacterium]
MPQPPFVLTYIVTILVGLWLAIKLFGAIAAGLQSPDAYRQTIEQWTALVGGDGLKVKIGEQEFALAPAVALAVIGLGLALLTWLSLGVMLTGAKIVSWSSGDREAVRRVLQQALGGARRG